jgi:rhodanese-related sulfurtransferase
MRLQIFLLWLLLVSGSFTSCTTNAQHTTNLTVSEFEKWIKQPNVQVLDVRTSDEYQSGHLKDAFLADWNNQQQFTERVQSLDKSKPVYTYCLSGVRSGAAAKWLRENGYTAYNLDGGIAAWKRASMPLEEAAKVKQMTLKEYQSLVPADKTVLVDVGAIWCPPCKKMNPIIDSLSKAKTLQFHLVKIDGGDQTEISKQLGVESFPTFIIYKNGKEVWKKSGIVSAKELVKQIQ